MSSMNTTRVGSLVAQPRVNAPRTVKRNVACPASKADELKQMEEYKAKLNQNLAAAAKPSAEVAAGSGDPAAAAAQDSLPQLTSANYWDLIKAESVSRPVMVDIYTNYCGPCKAIAPKLVQWQQELGEDKIKIYKFLAGPENKELGKTLGVKSVPCFIFYKNGEEVDRMTGAKFVELEALIKSMAGAA